MADQTPSGPDLAIGIPSTDLPDGGMLAGRVGDEAVLVARRGAELFAIAAHCSHWNGPLAEGLLAGHTVRCPWHHACFDLRTGRALRAPAYRNLPRWEVSERDGRVVVGRRIDPEPLRMAHARPAAEPESVVIIGAGAAGESAARTLRERGYDGPVTLLGDEPGAPCDRPNLSKDYLAGSAPEEWIPLHDDGFYAEQRIALRHDAPVAAIDPAARTVTLASGEALRFGALLLATGAEPVRLPPAVDPGGRIMYLRTLADSRAIREAAESGGRAVVLGASFIGLEVAAALRAHGVEVHVAAPESRPLERVLGPELGDLVRATHERHGVHFHLGQRARVVHPDAVELEDGTRIGADFVVAGIGVRPRVDLARAAGLAVDDGIVVDAQLRTGAPGVYAAGDVARWPDARSGRPVRIEHWVLAQRQGALAARNMLGEDATLEAPPFFWSQHFDIVVDYVGHAAEWDRVALDGNPTEADARVTWFRDGRPLAIATVGRNRESLAAELALTGNEGC